MSHSRTWCRLGVWRRLLDTPPPELRGHADEVARLKAQLQYQKKSNDEMKAMLHNQALAIDAFQHKWQMAGSEGQAFLQRTRSQSEDFVRCEMTAIERFESRRQREYECRIRDHVLTLQDEC